MLIWRGGTQRFSVSPDTMTHHFELLYRDWSILDIKILFYFPTNEPVVTLALMTFFSKYTILKTCLKAIIEQFVGETI